MKASSYLEYQRLVVKATAEPYPFPDRIAEAIFVVVAEADEAHQHLGVTDVMGMRSLASPATLHKRLVALEKTGFIRRSPIAGEYPNKQVFLTKQGRALLKTLDNAVRKAAKA